MKTLYNDILYLEHLQEFGILNSETRQMILDLYYKMYLTKSIKFIVNAIRVKLLYSLEMILDNSTIESFINNQVVY